MPNEIDDTIINTILQNESTELSICLPRDILAIDVIVMLININRLNKAINIKLAFMLMINHNSIKIKHKPHNIKIPKYFSIFFLLQIYIITV